MVSSGSGTPGSGEQSPPAGYYPDPSIPGYVRYWNGSAWVPGSSRPEPGPGEALGLPPDAAWSAGPEASGAPHIPAPPAPRSPLPSPARTPALDESGPMFLDEDPHAPVAQTAEETAGPAPGAPAAAPGRAADRAAAGPAPAAGPPAASARTPEQGGGYGYPGGGAPGGHGRPGAGAAAAPGGYGYPDASGGGGYGYPGPGTAGAASGPAAPVKGGATAAAAAGPGAEASWQQQVSELARKDTGPGVPGQSRGAAADGAPHVPWRPPAADPFLLAAQDQARPAGLGRRLAARLVDSLVVGAVVGAAAAPLALASARHLQHKIDAARQTGEPVRVWLIDGTTGPYLGIVLAVVLLAGLLYEVLPTAKWGRTLGKKLLGLRVLDIESQLAPGFGQALRRMLVQYGLQVVGVGVIDAVWCLFDRPWRQTWHDKAVRTFVASGG